MSSEKEKILNIATNAFYAKLSDRQVIKLEGMEDYLKVPQYKSLVNLENKASQLEVDAASRIMNSRVAYLRAAQELRECELRWLEEIRNGMNSLEERNKILKDVNMKMRKGDYSVLHPVSTSTSSKSNSQNELRSDEIPASLRKPEVARPALPPEPPIAKPANPDLMDIKKRLAMINISVDTPPARPPLHARNMNKPVEITETPKVGPFLSSKGSLDGSVVPNRAPTTPLSASKWDVPAPNFDDTMDTEPIAPLPRVLSALPSLRHLPPFLKSPDEEGEESDDTFPLHRPSLPFRTPTVPHSRPFLISSMRKDSTAKVEESLPVRPVPTSVSRPTAADTSVDPLSGIGLMKLKRPVLNSDAGKKLMLGQL